MSKLAGALSGGAGLVLAGAVALSAIGGALWYQQGSAPEQPDAPVVVEQASAPAPQEEVASAESAPEEAPAPPRPVILPAFDEVRREADGTLVIAGRGAPGGEVRILMDGGEIARTGLDGAGKFAAIAFTEPDGKPHVLSLLQVLGEEETASAEEIILAPLDPPVAVAAAEEEVVVAEVANDPAPEEVAEAETAPVESAKAEVAERAPAPVVVAEGPIEEPKAEESAPVVEVPAPVDETVEVAQQSKAEEAPDTAPVETAEVAEAATPVAKDEVASEEAPEEVAQVIPVETQAGPTEAQPVVVAEAPTTLAEATPSQPQAPAAEKEEAPDETVAEADATPQTPVAAAEVPTEAADAPAPEAEDTVTAAAEEPRQQEVALLKQTEEGVEVLNRAPPEVMDNVALDTISYSDEGDVQLAGRAQQEAEEVRVYLDNRAIATLGVDERGRWRGDLPDVDEGVYTLRVDEVDAAGQVTSRVETPFKREDPAVLAAAAAEEEGPIKAITVQKGATLWAIARDRYGKGELYVRVFEANRGSIRDPDLIYPGQIFDLPE